MSEPKDPRALVLEAFRRGLENDLEVRAALADGAGFDRSISDFSRNNSVVDRDVTETDYQAFAERIRLQLEGR